MTTGRFQILGIAGSLRRASYNRALLRAAEQLAPDGVDFRTFDLLPVPLYNADVEAEGDPAPVRELKEQIRAARRSGGLDSTGRVGVGSSRKRGDQACAGAQL